MAGVNLRELGSKGEDIAWDAYRQAGYRLITRNWHFHRMGEIDLILVKGDLLVFCEVKLRSNPSFAAASTAVGRVKRSRIRKLAQCFLLNCDEFSAYNVRFDVCEIIPDEHGVLSVNLIADAF